MNCFVFAIQNYIAAKLIPRSFSEAQIWTETTTASADPLLPRPQNMLEQDHAFYIPYTDKLNMLYCGTFACYPQFSPMLCYCMEGVSVQ